MTKCKGPCWNCSKCKANGNPSGSILPNEIVDFHKFDGLEELFCDDCDAAYVYPNKPETGKFFHKMGHVWTVPLGEYQTVAGPVVREQQRTLGKYVEVVWALCSKCCRKVEK